MYKQLAIIGTNTLVCMARELKVRGEITEEQFKEIERRNSNISEVHREDILIKKGDEFGRKSFLEK